MTKQESKKHFSNKKSRALSQIFLLILGIVSFGFILGSEVEIVSADTYQQPEVPKITTVTVANTPAEAGKTPMIESIAASTYGLKTGVAVYGAVAGTAATAGATAAEVLAAAKATGAPSAIIAKAQWATFKASGAGTIATAAVYAYAGAMATKMLFKLIGSNRRNVDTAGKVGTYVGAAAIATVVAITVSANIAAGATGIAIVTGGAAAAAGTGFASLSVLGLSGGPLVFAAVVVVAAAITFALRKTFSHEIFTYSITIWQPTPKGENCQLCNELEYGCSEYQCKTFGAACEIVNPGTTDELCDWINPYDMAPPIMETLDILPRGYRYNPDTRIELPDRGVTLNYEGDCLPAFEGIGFGITTDEPAQCKVDITRTYDYDSMMGLMAEGAIFTYNHTFSLPNTALPSAYEINEAGYAIDEGNNYEFYMRCKDVNDNISPYNFIVKFCVDDGPDTTAPTISTNYIDGAYVRSDQTEINDLEVYTNEPATCRWDFEDRDYDAMSYNMTECSAFAGDYIFPASYSYGCKTTLTGIKNNELNTYYIKCEDKPSLSEDSEETRIQNRESYVLNLQGTNGLVIDEIFLDTEEIVYTSYDGSEDGIKISDATENIEVRIDVFTSQGAEGGNARCSYSDSVARYEFYNNQNYDYTSINNHYWYLNDGNYDYQIRCCDLANNCDVADINFEVEADTDAPLVARSYYEDGLMKLVTSEEAECTYSLSTCNYIVEDGLSIETLDNLNHFISWNEKESFFVKCKDAYNNYPDPNECSIIVRAQYEYEDALSI